MWTIRRYGFRHGKDHAGPTGVCKEFRSYFEWNENSLEVLNWRVKWLILKYKTTKKYFGFSIVERMKEGRSIKKLLKSSKRKKVIT